MTFFRKVLESAFFMALVYTHVYILFMNELNPAQILQQIAQIQRMEPGKVCVIGQGPNGPYYNLQCREAGKPTSRYIPADQVEVVTQHTENYKKFEGLVSQYAQVIVAQTRAARAAGVKKKTRPPKSSWPKTRKSKR
jgi:hypothetical protein